MSDVKEPELIAASQSDEPADAEPEENAGLNKALDTYRKLIDRKDLAEPLTEKEQDNLEKKSRKLRQEKLLKKL